MQRPGGGIPNEGGLFLDRICETRHRNGPGDDCRLACFLRGVDESSLAGGFSDWRQSRELILQIAAVNGRYTGRA